MSPPLNLHIWKAIKKTNLKIMKNLNSNNKIRGPLIIQENTIIIVKVKLKFKESILNLRRKNRRGMRFLMGMIVF